jgi:peptidyl-prolyl cis-trans isomerase C
MQPTETPVELAALVNGDGITQAEFQAELARFRAAGTELATDDDVFVIQDMIDQLLLAQAAADFGFTVDEAMLESRIAKLDIGGNDLQTWLEAHGYTENSFRDALARSIAAAWMRDQVIAQVPMKGEQVHARQILLYNSEDADEVFSQLEAGADFETLAEQYDPLLGGDLGWFPRGYLTVPELDEVVFQLSPGEYSDIIETMLGFHIVQVIEQDPDHTLNPNTYRVVQTQALEQWLLDRRAESDIVIYSP